MTDLFENTCPCCKRPYDAKPQALGFAGFWAIVPNKTAKANAEKAWRKLSPADRLVASENVVRFYDWFAKTYPTASAIHPATYLNGKRWLDEAISGKPNAITEAARAAILAGLKSHIPSVREHSERIARRAGIQLNTFGKEA